MNLVEELQRQKKEMVEYLKLKLSIEDWHGVQDAASDIREIEAQLKVLRVVNENS